MSATSWSNKSRHMGTKSQTQIIYLTDYVEAEDIYVSDACSCHYQHHGSMVVVASGD
jgi:hypothetical protein